MAAYLLLTLLPLPGSWSVSVAVWGMPAAGAATLNGKRTGVWATRERMRRAERELAAQAEAS